MALYMLPELSTNNMTLGGTLPEMESGSFGKGPIAYTGEAR